MKYIECRENKEGKSYTAIRKGRKQILLIFMVVISLIYSCGVSRNIGDEQEEIPARETDYTLYDLTYVEGIKQKLNGNPGEAVKKFEEALKINPESDAANYEISRIAAMRRDYENAIKYGSRAARLDDQNSWYMLNMANIYIELSELDSAGVWLEKAVKLDPSDENEKFRLGNLYMETGNAEKAEEIFEEFYEKYGGNEQILGLLINTKIQGGKYEEAERILLKEMESDNDDVAVEGMLAELYRNKGDLEKAGRMYDKLLEDEQYNTALGFSYLEFLIENNEYDLLFKRLEKMMEREEVTREDRLGIVARLMQDSTIIKEHAEDMIKIGEEVLKEGADDAVTNLTISELYGKLGNKKKEIETLASYVDRHGENYYIWENLLLKLNEAEDPDMLNKYAGRASVLFNTAPFPKILYAYSLIEKEKYEEAKEELRKVRILVNNQEQFMLQILAMEAEIDYRQGDIESATAKFDEALEIEPANAMILNNYAYYLAEEGLRLNDALVMIEKCLTIEENITYLDTYAWILYKLGRYREAEKVMSRIFESGNINDAELLEHYAYIKAGLGECDEAVILWQSALREDKTKTYLIEEIRKCIEK